MTCIASSIPGRMRLRHPALRDPARMQQLLVAIGTWPGTLGHIVNTRTGSLLLTYDPSLIKEADCRARAESAIEALAPASPPPAEAKARSPRHSRIVSKRINTMSKRTMLASLAASMLLAAVGAKRGHIWTGLVFLHALGAHLWVYRRTLLK
ncbi:MAG: hypothetical protein PHS77_07255 [Gallionellaceae bacterium]|nr:hypothetical protein [Gallionellaceae bacterium]